MPPVKLSLITLLTFIALSLGLFFRFYNLDGKVYWNDEVWTSAWLSGHRMAEIVEQTFDGRVHTPNELLQYQRVSPERDWTKTVSALAADDPKQPPLYYLLLRLWAGLGGDSVKAIRSLSAGLSLLAFPALYWLCRELFTDAYTPQIALIFVALSPFHVLYAQEARPYSLWTAMILFSSAALLYALRQPTWWCWTLYAVSLALGLYTHTLFVLTAAAHALYVAVRWMTEKDANLRRPLLTAFPLAVFTAFCAFAPWLIVIVNKRERLAGNSSWMINSRLGLQSLFVRWVKWFASIFFDLNRGGLLTFSVCLLLLLLSLFAIYFLIRRSPPQTWLFVLVLVGLPVLTLMLPDLILGGRQISNARFLIPCFLGIQVAVAHTIARQIRSAASGRRNVWRAIMAVLSLSGLISLGASSQADSWWNKGSSDVSRVARRINQAPRPLLVGDGVGTHSRAMLSISNYLDSRVRLALIRTDNGVDIPEGFSDIFLLSPTPSTRQMLERGGYRIEPVEATNNLWRLIK